MGNFIAALASIPVPLLSKIVIVPHLWSPERWGSIPWTPPPFWVTELVSLIIIIGVAVVGGVMTSLQKCKRKDYRTALSSSKWHAAGYIIGRIFALLAFPLKTMMISAMSWMPFAKQMSEGMITFVFVLLFGSLGNSITRQEVCAHE